MQIHALLPRLSSKLGHVFPYHIAMQKSAHLIGWDYFAFFPQRAEIVPLPSQWIPSLADDLSATPKSLSQKMKILWANIRPFRKIFRQIEKQKETIVFIEHFEAPHLVSILLALLFLRPQFSFWILHRYSIEKKSLKKTFFRMVHWLLEKKIGNVRYLTDSQLLARNLEQHLKRKFSVVPIPHTTSSGKELSEKKKDYFYLWWPGGLIREDKGILEIQNLMIQLQKHPQCKLVLAEKARALFPDSANLHFVETFLSDADYQKWMKKVDVVLLPYSPRDYAHRTSGIFVETVVLGTLPIVTQNTWMAYELSQFDLHELIFDWKEPDLMERLSQLSSNKDVQEKLKQMRHSYQEFHSLKGFAQALQKIAE